MRADRLRIPTATVAVLAVLTAASGVRAQEAQADPLAAKESRERAIAEAARQYARAVAGDDETSAGYYQAFQYAIDGARKLQFRLPPARSTVVVSTPEDGTTPRPRAVGPAASASQPTRPRSIFDDPTWLKNEARRRREALRESPGRIFGGTNARDGDLPECVAVLGSSCVCTGTLIGPKVVITAGHCYDSCVDRIVFGNDVDRPIRTVQVEKAIRHPGFDPATLTDDLTLLILKEEVKDVTPAPIARGAEVDDAYVLHLAGFGVTNSGGLGRKLVVDVSVATATCTPAVSGGFGCHVDKEIVAGGNGHDSCNGDSGGPAYVKTAGGGLKLAGSTSRAAANSVANCGDGGIYVRLDRYLDWIKKTAEDNGAKLP